MSNEKTTQDLMQVLASVEHPEIAVTLTELGMINDANVEGTTANVTMALPMLGIPEMVRNALVESIREPIEELGLQLAVQFVEMTPEIRTKFFTLSQANWKGAI